MIRLTSDEGFEGWGESTALPSWGGWNGRYYGETPDTVVHLVKDFFAPIAFRHPLEDRTAILSAFDRAVKGHPFAKAGFSEALLDIVAKSLDVPVWQLLGGRRRRRVPIAHSIGFMSTAEAVAEAEAVMEEGARTIKIKIGRGVETDIELVSSIRSSVGANAELVLDANEFYGVADAIRLLRMLEEYDVRYVEQPVGGIDGLATVGSQTRCLLMADEAVWNLSDMRDMVESNAAPLASIYIGKAGGLEHAMMMDGYAVSSSVGTNVNGSGETGIGNLANIHLASAMESLAESCVIPVSGIAESRKTKVFGVDYLDDVLAESMEYSEGTVTVPQGAGWGIPIDLDKVRKYARSSIRIDEESS